MSRIPEPHEIADAYYANLERQYEALTRNAVCADCQNYNEVPSDWVSTPCGWCAEYHDFYRADERVKGNCDSFEPTAAYEARCTDEYEDERDCDDWDD